MIHCGIEFQVYQVKYFPVESLDDFEDETQKTIMFCPFCGEAIQEKGETK